MGVLKSDKMKVKFLVSDTLEGLEKEVNAFMPGKFIKTLKLLPIVFPKGHAQYIMFMLWDERLNKE